MDLGAALEAGLLHRHGAGAGTLADALANLQGITASPAPGLAIVEALELGDGEAKFGTDEGAIVALEDGVDTAGPVGLGRRDRHGPGVAADLDAWVESIAVEGRVEFLELGDGDAASLGEAAAGGCGTAVDDIAVGARGKQDAFLARNNADVGLRDGGSLDGTGEGGGAKKDVVETHGWRIQNHSDVFKRMTASRGG